MDRLRDLPIWLKLGLIMIVPTIATVVVGVSALVNNINQANEADRSRVLAQVSEDAGAFVHELQDERAATTMLLGKPSPSDTATAAFDTQVPLTDAAQKEYVEHQKGVDGAPQSVNDQFERINLQLKQLPTLRTQIKGDPGKRPPLFSAVFQYDVLITDLLAIRDSAAQLAGQSDLGDRMRVAASVSQAKEQLSKERIVVLRALNDKTMTPTMRNSFIGSQTAMGQALTAYNQVANDAEITLLNQKVAGADIREAAKYQGDLNALTGTDMPNTFDAAQWNNAMIGYSDRLRDVEATLDRGVIKKATAIHDNVQRQVLVQAATLLAVLLLSMLFAWLLARSMARALRELRHGALAVAHHGLPQAVARLRDPSVNTSQSPQQIAAQIAEPLPVRSRDEFGQVTEAFNAVHLEAVRTAAEQAALRASVATMFVNLARRSQILVDRLIGHLDRLERGEEDPDRLSELFQLDHLATRMRRNDENLLVLAGADSTRVQRDPASLIDVLRAAQSEVEHYTRIEFGMIDRDIEIGAHAVNDMVHLIAELLDNATAFSPPDSHVLVEARRTGDRAVLMVEDRGIGVAPDQLAELNERLAKPPAVDVTVSRMMGLVVVARLAARHTVQVLLRPGRERGTVAEVSLPASVLSNRGGARSGARQLGPSGAPELPAAPGGEFAGAAAGAGRGPLRSAGGGQGGRPGFGAPLALEPGPGTGAPERSAGPVGAGFAAFGSAGGSAPTPSGFTAAPPGGRPPAPAGDGGPGFGAPNGTGRPTPTSGPTFGGAPTSAPTFGGAPTSGAAMGGAPVSGAGPAGARPLPAWSDLTGAKGAEPARRPGGDGPARRPDWTVEGELADHGAATGNVPRPRDGFTNDRLTDQPSGLLSAADAKTVAQPPVSPSSRFSAPPPPPPVAEVPVRRSGPGQPRAITPINPRGAAPTPAQGGVVPPAWPPVQGAGEPGTDDAAPPAVPGSFAAALDMTTELPRIRPEDRSAPMARPTPPTSAQPVPVRPAQAAAAGPGGPSVQIPYADETIELPIFRELETSWFRSHGATSTPAPQRAQARQGTAPADTPASAPVTGAKATDPNGTLAAAAAAARLSGPTATAPRPPEKPAPVAGPSAPAPAVPAQRPAESATPAAPVTPPVAPEPAPASGWRTAADDGWQKAAELAQERDFEMTDNGLPKRRPMTQLVPGSIEKETTSSQRRTPEGVRGLLSAYHRGVQRGRSTKPGDPRNPQPSTAGPQSPQGGKEQEA